MDVLVEKGNNNVDKLSNIKKMSKFVTSNLSMTEIGNNFITSSQKLTKTNY